MRPIARTECKRPSGSRLRDRLITQYALRNAEAPYPPLPALGCVRSLAVIVDKAGRPEPIKLVDPAHSFGFSHETYYSPASTMVSKTITFIVRSIQALLALILILLVGLILSASFYNQAYPDGNPRDDAMRGGGNASQINMAMWCAVFSLLSVFWLVGFVSCLLPSRREEPSSDQYTRQWAFFVLIPEALNVVFYFSGAVALAAGLGVHSCDNETYTLNNGITNTASDTRRRCREAQAVAAFIFFALLAWIASAMMSVEAIVPWADWPFVASLVPWRTGGRDTESRYSDTTRVGEPPLAAFPEEPRRGAWSRRRGDWQDGNLEEPPQAANLRSWGLRSVRKKRGADGGPAVPAYDDGVGLDREDGRMERRTGGPEVTEHY